MWGPMEHGDWVTASALLDPRCYAMVGTAGGDLDVTVPAGRSWHVTNASAVYYGEPTGYAQDGFLLTRRSGFLRPLDARRSLTLGSGTRIRSNVGVSLAYILYCDPTDVLASDSRYAENPRGLFFDRMRRLRSVPTESLVLEATGGGAINDDVHADLPAVAVMLTSASVCDASQAEIKCPDWLTWAHLLDKINDSHAVRFADTLLHPLPPSARVTLRKGSAADQPDSTSPAVANPIESSVSLTFQRLPADW